MKKVKTMLMRKSLVSKRSIAIISIFSLLLCISLSNQPGNKPFRDLNKNGKMDIYEDPKANIENRVADLISQMTIEEKAGQMFIAGTAINPDGSIGKKEGQVLTGPGARMPTPDILVNKKHISHINIWDAPPVNQLAMGINEIQKIAEQSRLGIPVSVASDPRHYFSNNIFSMASNGFSQWPEQLGFAAIGDEKLMQQFADIARQEYLAVGIRVALHPMADLATEPRWPRCSGSFGEDANLSARLLKPYIWGFQNGKTLNHQGIACMTKHFSGGGPQKEGLDSHFEFHKGQTYPGNNFNYHLIPFEAAFSANTASIMPYYGIPTDQTSENVAMGFNKDIITKLLREKYKFDGIVCTDWGLITDVEILPNVIYPARAWGLEHLSEMDRVKRVIEAGCDQFGGENCVHHIVNLIRDGKVSEERINQSLARILKQKFVLGLFENPYVNVDKVSQNTRKPEWVALGEKTQRRSLTLLKNTNLTCPLKPNKYKIFIKGVKKEVAEKYGTVVDSPEKADFAIIRANTPWVPVETKNPFAKSFHHGDLDFKGNEKAEIIDICKKVPTIFNIYLDRPAVITEIDQVAKVVIADYGANDGAVLDVIFGKAKPEGKLPFELPSSMESVRNQKEDVPYDSKDPLYKFGFGMRYK
jgi:beta-glucosidase